MDSLADANAAMADRRLFTTEVKPQKLPMERLDDSLGTSITIDNSFQSNIGKKKIGLSKVRDLTAYCFRCRIENPQGSRVCIRCSNPIITNAGTSMESGKSFNSGPILG